VTPVRLALIASIACMLGATDSSAADGFVIPTDPVAKAAFDALERSCARCHQEGRLSERQRPEKNFGNILKLDNELICSITSCRLARTFRSCDLLAAPASPG